MPRFNKMDKAEHLAVSAKGGKKSSPKKGFGSLSKAERSLVSKRAARARWDKVTSNKEVPHGQTDDSSENSAE